MILNLPQAGSQSLETTSKTPRLTAQECAYGVYLTPLPVPLTGKLFAAIWLVGWFSRCLTTLFTSVS